MSDVSPSQRHSRNNPCIVCGGYEQMKRGQGERCTGFVSDDGKYVHCSREERSGGLPQNPNSDTYAHVSTGDCRCGQVHGQATYEMPAPPLRLAASRDQPKVYDSVEEVEKAVARLTGGEVSAQYHYDDGEDGDSIELIVFRCDLGDGEKTFRQASPEGDGWKLNASGVSLKPYRLTRLRDAIERDEPIYIVEGEKDVQAIERAGGVATCNPMGAGKNVEQYAHWFQGADCVYVIADQDEVGIKHAENWRSALRPYVVHLELKKPAKGKDAHDALTELELDEAFEPIEGGVVDTERARFSAASTSISFVFDSDPPPREFLIDGVMPAGESGLIAAAGGTGKGHLQILLALSLAMGAEFCGSNILRPRGVVLVSVEDDRNELHRRFKAALDLWFSDTPPGTMEKCRPAIEKRVQIVDLRGTTSSKLGSGFRENLLPVVDRLEDPGLILIDPLSRLLPELDQTGGVNSQEGAGIVLNQLDALRTETGCGVIAAHHVSKEAIRSGGQLKLTAATGSQQLVDLSRWVMNLAKLTPDEVNKCGLHPGHYLEAAIPKSNYTPELDRRLVFQRCAGGALRSVAVEDLGESDEERAFTVLQSIGEWTSYADWKKAAGAVEDGLSKGRFEKAVPQLRTAGRVISQEWKKKRTKCTSYAPADWKKLGWPDPPKDC
jgi:RecA-family ATPase/5S rRNA maturation endonuclease (ribonuclease M5)